MKKLIIILFTAITLNACHKEEPCIPFQDIYEFNLIGEQYTLFWSPFYYTDPDGSSTEVFEDGSIDTTFLLGEWLESCINNNGDTSTKWNPQNVKLTLTRMKLLH